MESLFPHLKIQGKKGSLGGVNTYTNADKLLEAAEQLAQTGECDPEEIYKAARHLEVRIQDFVRRVEQRKLLLDMSVSFHTHTKETANANLSPHLICMSLE
uniref:Uncharacterized protein n=1 Tax=Sphaerodactylus townsendi TaxID=933632 RepID=A0ACB8G2G0_9SAUR